MAHDGGATDAECTISEGEQFSASVRMGEVENLKEAGSRGVGVCECWSDSIPARPTPPICRRTASATWWSRRSNWRRSPPKIPHAGLPDREDLGRFEGDLQLYSTSVAELPPDWKIERAKRAEAAALAADPRIANSEGASFDTTWANRVRQLARLLRGSYRNSSCSLSAVPVAQEATRWSATTGTPWLAAPRVSRSPRDVGRRAAERALRRLGARKVATQKVPVVFEPRVARSLIDNIFDAVSGDSVYRGESFLAGKLGQKVASENVTVIDDATMPGLFGTSPFDDEGVPSRRTVVIENGVLKTWLLNTTPRASWE